MLENRSDCRMVISSVLNRTHFYFLPLAKLTQILKLLEMPETSEPNAILQYVFTGIMRLYQKYKQKIGSHLFNQKFAHVSKESKELLYNIFLHIHSQFQSKPQSVVPPLNIPPYNLNMLYQQNSGGNFNLENPTIAYDEEMKKYIEAAKMYPYYFMNPQLGSGMNPSLNPSLNPSPLNPSLSSQFGGLHMPMSNPYLGYPGNSSLPVPPYGQLKNLPRGLSASGLPFGMSSYSSPSSGSMYPPQYMGPYSPSNLLGGYGQGQSVPPSFSHAMGLEKNQMNSKAPDMTAFGLHQEFEKKFMPSQALKNDLNQRHDKDKSVPKDSSKFMLPHRNLPFNPQLTIPTNSTSTKPQDPKSLKSNSVQLLPPKKQPFKDAKKLSEANLLYKSCACKGLYEYQSSFTCSICSQKFHYRCLSLPQKPEDYTQSQVACAHCRMRTMDPLNKVQQTLGQFYLMNLYERGFISTINFRPYQSKCKDKQSKYEIEIRCIRSGEHMKNLEITWPDQCQIKINNDRIVDIPALQSNSSLKKRKDYSVFITQNIYLKGGYMGTDASSLLQRVKISLQLKPLTPEQASSKRIRNDYTFALGIYLVEKLNVDQLYAKIMSEQKVQDVDFLKNLMKTKEDQVEIDKITIRLIDPFSWDFIKTPVRGHQCNHAQCFDLKTFISLMYSAKNRTWKCPLCTRDARKFMLDNQQLQLIKKAHEFDPIPKEVSIYKQGKVAFKIQKDSQDEDEGVSQTNKTKKIVKDKKEEVIKEK